jgi:tetratricopeptide (TPR) repeat protein
VADALGLSWLNVDAGRLEAGFQEAQDKVRNHPADAGSRCQLGICELKRGQHEAAITEFEMAATLAPQAPGPLYLQALAVAFGRSWLSPMLSQLAEKALRLNPHMKEARSLLYVYKGCESLDAAVHQSDYEAALQEFRQALELQVAEQLPHIYYFSGQAFDGAEDAENAIKMYQEACQLGLADAKVLIRLGVLLAKTGEYQSAVCQLEKAEELDPTNDSVQQLLSATRAELAKKRS